MMLHPLDAKRLQELAGACDYDLERLSQRFGISSRHLHRWFKVHMESTPGVWLREQRLQRARCLLATSTSVKEVAYDLGFRHVSQFCRDFRRRFGHRPSAARTPGLRRFPSRATSITIAADDA